MKVGEVECCEDLQESNQNKTHHNFLQNKKAPKLGAFLFKY